MEFIRDQKGGARTLTFADLTDKELQARAATFPEALQEWVKRYNKRNRSTSK